MSLTSFLKAAFAIIYGYDVDTVTTTNQWKEGEPAPFAMDYAPFPSEDDLNGFQPYLSLSGHVPSRSLSIWRHRRFAAI
ncbi:hypothetical protein K466DRAFT_667202 [Polyporus arcularius HHB13444]|uniref:Uncharacterized protein n=1 Tax=Polyporus arcularius HHB13444 TaxID=1314778 RepID=A0A5C3NV08_9APHY|nr:hypothetical protein K466DRAFT_667202 [Polyporus arcularius HHB13444]